MIKTGCIALKYEYIIVIVIFIALKKNNETLWKYNEAKACFWKGVVKENKKIIVSCAEPEGKLKVKIQLESFTLRNFEQNFLFIAYPVSQSINNLNTVLQYNF